MCTNLCYGPVFPSQKFFLSLSLLKVEVPSPALEEEVVEAQGCNYKGGLGGSAAGLLGLYLGAPLVLCGCQGITVSDFRQGYRRNKGIGLFLSKTTPLAYLGQVCRTLTGVLCMAHPAPSGGQSDPLH